MEISDLLSRLKGVEKDKPQPFLALEITDEVVAAAVWQVEEGKTNIVSLGIPVEWNGESGDAGELVKAADATISNATEGLEAEPSQIIFGVANSWASDQGVLPTKLKFLKDICKELELKPLGFVVVTDSLLRYLKMQEGTPATCILVQINSEEIIVTLVKLGKIEGVQSIGRGDDVSADVEEALSRFKTKEELPSRILVFNNMHSLEEEVQNLISYDWKNKFNFLHIPKIESLPKDVLIRSIAVAGGAEVAKAIGFEIEEPTPEENPVGATLAVARETPDDLLPAEDFGFTSPDKKSPPPSNPAPSHITLEPDELAEPVEKPLPKKSPKPRLVIPKFKVPKLPKFKLPSLGRPAMLGIFVLLLILVFAGSAVWLVPKASVTVYVEPKTLEENVDLTLSTAASAVDQVNSTIPASPVNKTVSGEETVDTTGKKTVGDPAKGTVTVYNRTGSIKTFAKGTTLSNGSLKFTFDDSVTVASRSAGADYVDVPGKTNAKITAKTIGSESNLAAGTEFVIENFAKDTYVAKNDNSLTGGSSRDVQVVAQADKTNVSKALLTKLRDQGKQELSSELGLGQGVYIMEKGSKLSQENYSVDVGSEATALTASYQLDVKGVSYSTSDVENLMSSQIQSAMPSGYQRTADPPSVELGDVKSESDNSVEVAAKVTVKLLPVVDMATVQRSLRGVGSGEIEQNLGLVVGFKGASVEITPKWLPPRFKHMPRNPNNISVQVLPAPV